MVNEAFYKVEFDDIEQQFTLIPQHIVNTHHAGRGNNFKTKCGQNGTMIVINIIWIKIK